MLCYDVATLRMAGALEKSGEVMKYMQQLVKVPEISRTMQEMSKEMMKVCLQRMIVYNTDNHSQYIGISEATQTYCSNKLKL